MSTADRAAAADSDPGLTGSPVIRLFEEVDGILVLGLAGDFDVCSAPLLDRAVGDGARNLVIDLAGVTFVDAAVVRTLLAVSRRVFERGRVCVVELGTVHIVDQILEITGVAGQLLLAHDRAEAIRLVREHRRLGSADAVGP